MNKETLNLTLNIRNVLMSNESEWFMILNVSCSNSFNFIHFAFSKTSYKTNSINSISLI